MSNQATNQENTTAGVMPAAPWRINSVSVLPEFRLEVTFCDSRYGIVDCSAIRSSCNLGIYVPLVEPDFFAHAKLELEALVWPNGANLDPDWLHAGFADTKSWPTPF